MNPKFIILFCSICIGLFACSELDEPENPVRFTQCASLPVRASATAFVVDGTAYVFGGRTNERNGYLNDFWQYNPLSDTWIQLSDVPFKARVKATAQVVDGKVYCGLGFNGRVYTDSCYLRDWWCYDVHTDTWTRKADYPIVNTDAVVSFVEGQFIYVAFGFGYAFSAWVYRYDTELDVWEKYTEAPFSARAGTVGCRVGTRYFAGMGYDTDNCRDWYEFFPTSKEWIKQKRMPSGGRIFASALAIDEHLFILGGRFFGGTETREKFYDEVMEYDYMNEKWLLRGRIPTGGRENMFTFSINGKGYFGGGANDTGEILGDLYCFY